MSIFYYAKVYICGLTDCFITDFLVYFFFFMCGCVALSICVLRVCCVLLVPLSAELKEKLKEKMVVLGPVTSFIGIGCVGIGDPG